MRIQFMKGSVSDVIKMKSKKRQGISRKTGMKKKKKKEMKEVVF